MQKTFDISRKLMRQTDLMNPGILSCQGCGGSLAMKLALKGLGKRTAIVLPACCWTVICGAYPYTALDVPLIHVPFETAGVAASGVRAAFDMRGEEDVVVMAWAGDGGTFDIGLQSLSGAAERNEDIIYVCYDNEAYMNTGIQRSSATPTGAVTTTTPAGAVKSEPKKDIELIMMAHHIPYLATASIAYPDDFIRKFQKARQIKGTRFIHILSPCPPGWRIDPAISIQLTRDATKANVFPIYEVEDGAYHINVIPEKPTPIQTYIEKQGRFKGVTPETIAALQEQTDQRWEALKEKAGLVE